MERDEADRIAREEAEQARKENEERLRQEEEERAMRRKVFSVKFTFLDLVTTAITFLRSEGL